MWKLLTYSLGASRNEPCQDISLAGLGAGLSGARSGLWFEFLRLIRELRPRFVVAENVAALVTRGLDVVLSGLAESGYDALWFPLRASDVGAPHRRERVFIVAWRVADANSEGWGGQPDSSKWSEVGRTAAQRSGEGMADANGGDDAGRGDDAQWYARGRAAAERAGHEWPPPPNDAEAWAAYLKRHPGRAPAVGGKLNPGSSKP